MSDDLELSPADLIREHKGQPYVDGASDTVIEVRLLLDADERRQLIRLLRGGVAALQVLNLSGASNCEALLSFVAMEIAKAERKAAVKS